MFSLTGDILMFLAGTAITWSSPEISKLTNATLTPFERPLDPNQGSWISSLVTLGAAFGSFLFTYLADKIGRRYTLLTAGVPFIACYFTLAFANEVELFYCARFVLGFTVGGVFSLLPIYAGEIADKKDRGILGSMINCAVCLGFLFSYALGPFVSIMFFNLVLAAFSALFFITFAFLGEEVPHYYISINEENLAKEVLQKLRGEHTDIDEELDEIQTKFLENSGSFREICASSCLIKALTTAVGLFIFQQFSGINVVLFYSQKIFKVVGANFRPEICAIIIGGVQFLSSFIYPTIGDQWGRKILLFCSALGMVLSLSTLGAYSYLQSKNIDLDNYAWLPLLCLTLFIVTYNSGYGPLPWVMLGELFPVRVKSIATSIASFVNWILAFFITKYFTVLMNSIGIHGYFWLSAGCCVVAAIFAKFYVIDTKGKTLEEIQDELSGQK